MTIDLNHRTDILAGIAPEWATYCERWLQTSSLKEGTRKYRYYLLLKAGRWLSANYPDVISPEQWTRDIAIAYVAAVDKMSVGDWTVECRLQTAGKPLFARSKAQRIRAVQAFFLDAHSWDWFAIRFDPNRCFVLSRTLRNAMSIKTLKVIDDAIWAKLLYAGLNLVEADLALLPERSRPSLVLLRAVAVVWLFAGLRPNEILRLRLGCVEGQHTDWRVPYADEILPKNSVCLLEVPPHKSGNAFRKPVHPIVGHMVKQWEQARPDIASMLDPMTGQRVDYLFVHRKQPLSQTFINRVLIPLLCRKMEIPESDSIGRITCSRARITIATQLANGKHPMSLIELQAWLGHKTMESTQHYIQTDLSKRIATFRKAEYFKNNLRRVQVLLDRDAVQSGAATEGEPFLYYDLGHGYCTYDFFDQCPHRMACVRCSYYRPLEQMRQHWKEARTNLEYYLEEIPLTEAEQHVIEGDLEAVNELYEALANVPTPSGRIPREISSEQQQNVVPIETIEIRRTISRDGHSIN